MYNQSTYVGQSTVRKRAIGLLDFLSFGVGILAAIYINLSGNLYLAEILLLILLPYLLYARKRLLEVGQAKWIVFLGIAWLINQVIADLYRGTASADMIRGWGLIAILITNFLALYLLVFPDSRRITWGLLGYAIALRLQQLFQPNPNMLNDLWKFGLGSSLALLICVIGVFIYNYFPRNISWWSLLLLAVSAYSFYVRSRSLGGIALLTTFVVWLRFTRFGRWLSQRMWNPVIFMVSTLLMMAASWGVIQAYGYVAEQGYFGEVARTQYQMQSSGDFGILLGGRQAWLPAVHAILDSPFLGFGSYAHNTDYGQFLYDLTNLGYIVNNDQLEKYLSSRSFIPTHSHLLQGWVWAGLAGGVFWLFILVLAVRVLIVAYRYPSSLFLVTIFLGFSSIWSVLFSPLSNIMRLQWAFALVTFLYALASQPDQRGKPRDKNKTL